MAQDPHRLAEDLQRLLRDFPIGASSSMIEQMLIEMMGDRGYTLPPPARYEPDPEHEDITTFRLDPTVAIMSVGDVEILLEEVLKGYVDEEHLVPAVKDVVGMLQP